ncbi:MAG: hypothetical protein IPL60_02990 [Ardenticatenia bacterium]|nr:hypothetical protein [Ardenticatenia bacterium]
MTRGARGSILAGVGLKFLSPGIEIPIANSYRPFMAISVGDYIDPMLWFESQSPMKYLRVTRLEHVVANIKSAGIVQHVIRVYTTEVDADSVG